jgi:hypothetical protein
MNQSALSSGQEYARSLKESLFGKTGAKSFQYFYYAGGNKESRLNYFMKRFGDASLQPDFVKECECTHWIKDNSYVEYMPNDVRWKPPKLSWSETAASGDSCLVTTRARPAQIAACLTKIAKTITVWSSVRSATVAAVTSVGRNRERAK